MFFNEFNYRESSLLCIISPSSKKNKTKKIRKSQRPFIDTKTKTPRPLTERSLWLWDNCVGSFKKHREAPWGAQSVSQSGGSVLLCKLFFLVSIGLCFPMKAGQWLWAERDLLAQCIILGLIATVWNKDMSILSQASQLARSWFAQACGENKA